MTFYQSEASISSMGPNWFEMDLDRVIGLAYWVPSTIWVRAGTAPSKITLKTSSDTFKTIVTNLETK